MTSGELLIAFFLFTLAAVSAAGYAFVLKPSRAEGESGNAPILLTLDHPELPTAQAAAVDVFRMMGEALPAWAARTSVLRRELAAAGYRWPSAVSVLLGIKCATALMLAAVGAWIAVTFGEQASNAFLPAGCGLAFGYMVPDRILTKLARRRSALLRRGLPAALDLMVLAVEAGQALDASILDTSRGLRISHPDLAAEFTQLHLELKANTSREDALRNFARRTRDSEIQKFAALLIDTDRFGTSLGPALRVHARYLRTRFRQGAQEKARKVGVKLIFPVFFLIFPSVVLVTLGPAVLLIFTQMKNLVGQ
ncbi:MAG TPA: type II secretion system F family protein [Bryobacteraceae bacterium]|jgi:tight adherence protein C|nr:type II secretion system F family protein [Bryobacteraceae bacterium]